MLIKEFVDNILKEFETLPKPLSESEWKNLFTLFTQRRPIDPTIMDRSYYHTGSLYPAEIAGILNHHKNSDLEATHGNLIPFINLLREQWDRIKEDDRQYNILPDSITNRAYMIVAKQLSKTLNGNFYDYLMPDAENPDKWQKWFSQQKPLEIGEVHEYFITDTGEVIESIDTPKSKF